MTGFRAPGQLLVAALAFLSAGWPGFRAAAHPAYLTAARVTVESDGRFTAQFRFDLLAYVLNDSSARIGNEPMEALLAGPRGELETALEKAQGRLTRGFRVVTDAGDGEMDAANFPDAEQVLAWCAHHHPVLPVVLPIRLTGHLPPGARTVACRFPTVLDQVILTTERPDEEPEAEAVEAGQTSTALPVRLEAVDLPATKRLSTPESKPPLASVRPAINQPQGLAGRTLLGLLLFVILGAATFYQWRRPRRGS